MAKNDFDLIIIESFRHDQKQTFFKNKRKEFKCIPADYISGLMESFKRLNAETHLTDRTRCVITKSNGDEFTAKIKSDEVEVGYADEDETDKDNETAWSKEVAFYGTMGKVSFPFKNDIHINRPEFSGTLTAEMMENLWPDLQLYLQSIIDKAEKKINALNNDQNAAETNALILEGQRLLTEQLKFIIDSGTCNEPIDHTTKEKVKIPVLKDNSELKEKAHNILIVLSGLWINKEKIMTDEDYTKVINGVIYLIDTEKVKPIDKQINTSASMQFIKRLFWTIHKELYTVKSNKKSFFIDFLHAYFKCFNDTEKKTTYNNFKDYPHGDFDKDYKKVLESIIN